MQQAIALSVSEKEQFVNLKMLQDLRNLISKKLRALDTEIKTHNNRLVTRINQKYNVTTEADYTYDEVNKRLLHCLGNSSIIESGVTKIIPSALLDAEVETEFGLMLARLSKTYKDIEQIRSKEGMRHEQK